jgi:hypothetical protein
MRMSRERLPTSSYDNMLCQQAGTCAVQLHTTQLFDNCWGHSPSMGEMRSDRLMDCSSSVGMTVRPLSITPVTLEGGGVHLMKRVGRKQNT